MIWVLIFAAFASAVIWSCIKENVFALVVLGVVGLLAGFVYMI